MYLLEKVYGKLSCLSNGVGEQLFGDSLTPTFSVGLAALTLSKGRTRSPPLSQGDEYRRAKGRVFGAQHGRGLCSATAAGLHPSILAIAHSG